MPRVLLNFKEEDEKTALIREVFTSVRHSSVMYLLMDGPKTPTQLAKLMGVSRTAVTLTLNKFLELGMIEKKKSGKEVLYSANNSKACGIVKEIIIKNIKEKSPAMSQSIDYEKIDKLFEKDDFKSLLGICCAKVAREKKYPFVRIIDDFLNTVHIVYVNAAIRSNAADIDHREVLIRMNKEIKGGFDELMKVYLTSPVKNYKENLEWFKRMV